MNSLPVSPRIGRTLLRGIGMFQPDRHIRNLVRTLRRRSRKDGHYNILGLCSTGHGASFALVSSIYGVRALNFERFIARKYALLLAREELREFEQRLGPIASAIRFALSNRDGSMPPAVAFEDAWEPFLASLLRGLPLTAADIDIVVASECHFALNRAWLGRPLSHLFPNAAVYTDLEHHAIHRYQAYLGSGFDNAAILTADSSGENLARLGGNPLAMTLAHATGDRYTLLAEHLAPISSPGNLYGFVNDYLGFDQGEEGKTMGLSSFGRDSCYRYLRPHLSLNDDGSFCFLDRAQLTDALYSLGIMRRNPEEPITSRHEDLACAAQLLLNDIMRNAVGVLERRSTSENLCVAGGTALNSISNEIVFRSSRFKRLYVMPNAGDCGHALGCALYAERTFVRPPSVTSSPSPNVVATKSLCSTDALGPPYTDADVEAALADAGLPIRSVVDVAAYAAELLNRGLIVAWFQGGSEFGPRSLGQRSILADPRSDSMKDYLNDRVKHREPFRPFAPAVLEDRAEEFFNLSSPSPFMLRVVEVLSHRRSTIPAVTHVDGTARVQTVNSITQPRFYALIQAFAQRTGVPVVLNTSFNVAGKPIVETPQDAIACYLSTNIDALVLHDYVAEKQLQSEPPLASG
jgi:carbamoyltransferase